MQIEIDGMRSSDDAWHASRRASLAELPELSQEDLEWAQSLHTSPEKYARTLYAERLTMPDLIAKCKTLGKLAVNWLQDAGIEAEVLSVRLRCTRGLFDLKVSEHGDIQKIEIREDVVDNLLQRGSRESEEALSRLFAANFGRTFASKAS